MSDFFNLIERVFFFAKDVLLIDEVAFSVHVFTSGGAFLISCSLIDPRGFTL